MVDDVRVRGQMTRDATPYNARREFVAPEGYGIRIDQAPRAGFYRAKLRSGAMYAGVRIWFGPPLDPDTGEEMDRSLRWQAQANGKYIDLDRVWPGCAADPIDEAEYAYLTRLREWGEQHAPDSPQANAFRSVNLLTAPILI